MKVEARTNIKYGDGWYMTGETFEIEDADYPDLKDMVKAAGSFPAAEPVPVKEEPVQDPAGKPEEEPVKQPEKADGAPARPKPSTRRRNVK